MKRIVALLMILGLLALFCVPALAAKEDVLTVTGDTTCAPGSTLTLSFGIKEGTKLSALNVEVSYDTDTFEFVNYENGELITDALAAGNGTDGKVLFTLATLTPITKGGTLFTATFKVDSKATGNHSFFYYSTLFNVDDGSASGKDIEVTTVEHVMTVGGEKVSSVAVTPVYSTTDEGAQSVVSAQNGESATGVLVPGASKPSSNSSQDGQSGGSSESSQWVVVGVVVLALGALALLVVAAVAKAKKGDKELNENQSILTDEAKALLDLDKDALEEKEDKE